MKVKVNSTSMFHVPGMLNWAIEGYKGSSPKQKKVIIETVNQMLFRGNDEAAAKDVVTRKLAYTVEGESVLLDYTGDALNKLTVAVKIKTVHPLTNEQIDQIHHKLEMLILPFSDTLGVELEGTIDVW